MSQPSSQRFSQALIAGLLLFAGCQPPPPEEDPLLAPLNATPARAKEIVLVMPAKESAVSRIWEQVCRQEAGVKKMLIRIVHADEPTGQAELIKKVAGEEGVRGLVIVPDDSETLASAIKEAATKVKVVILGKEVPGVEGAAATVTTGDLKTNLKQVVDAAVEDAKKAGFPAEGPAVILASGIMKDAKSGRIEMYTELAKEAGLTLLPAVEFAGTAEDASKAIKAFVEANPKVAIVLADDENGLNGSQTYRATTKPLAKFITAGVGNNDTPGPPTKQGEHAGFLDFVVMTHGRKAVWALVDLIDGKLVDKVQVQPTFLRGPGRVMMDQMIESGRNTPQPETEAAPNPSETTPK